MDEDVLEASGFFTFDALDPSLSRNIFAAHGHYDAVEDEFINCTCTFSPDNLAEYLRSLSNLTEIQQYKLRLRTFRFICEVSLRITTCHLVYMLLLS